MISRIDLPDPIYQRSWSVANAAERATLLSSGEPRRGDMIFQADTGIHYLVVESLIAQQISGLAGIPINLATQVTGVLPTANGGTSVDIASAALPLGFGQITFPAVQNPSANVNTLDDFEKGDWTPVIGGDGGTSGQTYAVQVGKYVKKGPEVSVWGVAELSNKGIITGNVEIQGLPFTSLNVSGYFAVGPINWFFATPIVLAQGRIGANSTTASIRALAAAAAFPGGLTTADINNGSAVVFSAVYRANS